MPIATNPQTGETVFLTPDGQWEKAQTAINPTTKEQVAFDGKEWKPVPTRTKGAFDYVDDAVRSIANGVTFGYGDEIAARMDSLIGRGTYDENYLRESARSKQIPAAISLPGEVAGAVAGSVAAAPVLAPAAAATGLARLPQALRYVLGGAAGGAAFGSGEADPGNRLAGAAQGAALGGAAGYAVPKVMGGLSSLTAGIRNAVAPQSQAAADLGRAILRDETNPTALSQALQDARTIRPEATLADVGGENVRGLVERIAQTPGAGRTTVVPELTTRQQAQMNRLGVDLAQLTGTHRTATQAVAETMEQRANAATPLYKQAMEFDAASVPEIAAAFQRETATGFGRAMATKPEYRRLLQTEYGIKDPAEAPLMVAIDAWKKVADDYWKDNRGTNSGRVVRDMINRVVGVVDQYNPAYAKARDAWSGPSGYLEAIDKGRGILQTRMSAEELRATINGMSEAEREAFRIGAVSAIRAKMGSDPARMADMTKYLRAPEVRDKIASIMPDDAAREAWSRRLDYEMKSSELVGRALGNSATYRRMAERQDADGLVADLVLDAFNGTPPVGILRNLVGATRQRVRDTLRSRSDNLLADALVNPQGQGNLPQLLQAAASRGAPPSALRDPAAINASNSQMQ